MRFINNDYFTHSNNGLGSNVRRDANGKSRAKKNSEQPQV